MANTRAECEAECYQILGEIDTSNEYSPAIVQEKISDVYSRICHGKIIRLDNDQIISAKRLPFLELRTPINFHSPSSVGTGGALIGATTIPITDTTHYLVPTGSPIIPEAVYIKGNLITYTGISGGNLTGVSGLVIDLNAGDIVHQLFPISNINIYKPKKLSYQYGDIEQTCHELREGDYTTNKYFTIINNLEERFLLIKNYSDGTYRLNYFKQPTPLTADSSVLDLPGNAGIYVVAPIAMAELLWKTEEIEFAKEKGKLGYNACVEFYDSYNSNTKRDRQQIGYNFVGSEEILGARNAGGFGNDED